MFIMFSSAGRRGRVEKEAADGAVSVRQHGEGDIGSMEKGEFIRFFQDKVAELIQ